MNGLNRQHVLDQMSAELAARRHSVSSRRAAYLALARAILSDEHSESLASASLERQPTALGQSSAAA